MLGMFAHRVLGGFDSPDEALGAFLRQREALSLHAMVATSIAKIFDSHDGFW